jgi:Tfp pilus assembly protein PilV
MHRATNIRSRLADEGGFSLVELLVAAVILVIGSIGILTALEAAGRAGAEERYHAQAYEVAQQDQARLRATKVTALLGLNQTRTVTLDNTTYTVKSTSKFTTDSTGTQACDSGVASADYLSVDSTVTWPSMGSRPAVAIESIIAPPNGSFDENNGALAVAVRDGTGAGVPNIPLSGTGAGTFSGATGDNGCAIFGNLPQGNYTLTPSASAYVDKDGNAPGSVATSVVAQSTNSVALQLGRPGSITATFQTKVGTGNVTSSSDTVTVFNTGMTAAETFGTVGTRVASVSASPLFPFSSQDTVYAGACIGNNPTAAIPLEPLAQASVAVNAGGPASPALITLPALNLTVMSGASALSPGVAVNNARVTVTDKNCSIGGTPVKRVLATNASGKLTDPGLPYSTYDVCVSNTTKRVTTTGVAVKNATTPANLTVYLGSAGAVTGVCP